LVVAFNKAAIPVISVKTTLYLFINRIPTKKRSNSHLGTSHYSTKSDQSYDQKSFSVLSGRKINNAVSI